MNGARTMVPKIKALAAAFLLACPAIVLAQSEPQQGGPPALREPVIAGEANSFVLQGVDFEGVTGVPESEVQTAVAAFIGQRIVFADLEQIAAHVTLVYRKHGFVLAQAFVPAQKVEAGKVRLVVSEGVLGSVGVDVADDAPVSKARVEKTLALLEPGKPLNTKQYERAMLLLSDLPGIVPQSSIAASASGDATDLTVQVSARNRVQTSLEANNHGTEDAGRYRLSGSLRWASPFKQGDNLDLRLMVADGAHTAFGRISYETPVGHSGLRVGGGLARVQYELGGPFAALEPTGVADVVDLSLSYPILRSRSTNLFLRGMADRKAMTSAFDAVGYESKKRIQGIGIGLSFEHRDKLGGGGYTSANGMWYRGNLDLFDATAVAFDKPPFGYGTAGSFSKFTLQVGRLQALAPKLHLFVGVGLQRAGGNLDSYEKLSLGGPKAVRAYATGETLVDDGWVAALELRYVLRPAATAFVFYDAADGDFFHSPRPFDVVTSRSLRGYGLGLNWAFPKLGASMSLTLAWRHTGAAFTDTGAHDSPRAYWSIQKAF